MSDKGTVFLDGEVYNPRKNTFEQQNIAIRNQTVVGLGYLADDKDDDFNEISIKGSLVIPNTIDCLVHRGRDHLTSLSAAAAHGGVTGIALSSKGRVNMFDPEGVALMGARAQKEAGVKVHCIGALTKESLGENMSELALMKQAGAIAFSDCSSIEEPILMRNLLRYSEMLDRRIFIRPLNQQLLGKGVIHEGYYSTILGLKGISYAVEETRLARDLQLMESFGGKLFIGPVSTASGVELIRHAKSKGLDVMACTALHYLYYDHKDLDGYNTNLKVFPPIREKVDQEALIEGIKDGTLDIIISDHHSVGIDEKRLEFDAAECGISSLDHMVPLLINKLVHEEGIDLDIVLKTITSNPMKVYGLKEKGIALTNKPTFTVIDPTKKQTITASDILSYGKNSPYLNKTIKGKVTHTVINGELVFSA